MREHHGHGFARSGAAVPAYRWRPLAVRARRCRNKPCHPRIRRDRAVIVVCGEALIDMVVSRDGTRRPAPGGGPFNTARALARLGVPTAFLGHFSEDQLPYARRSTRG